MDNRNAEQYERIEFNLSCQGQAHFKSFKEDRRYVPLHWHEAVEIIATLDGELSVMLENQTYQLHAGGCFIVSPYVLHSTMSVSGNNGLLLQIPIQAFPDYSNLFVNQHIICDPNTADPEQRRDLAHVFAIMKGIMELEESGDPVARLRSISLLWELLYVLRTRFARPLSDAAFAESSRKNRERLAAVLNYTVFHYSEPITLEDVAREMHLQVNYFCHFFKKNTGMTYLQYLSEYRLSMIYHDLLTTDIPLKYLLERHGFTNYKRFRELFYERFQTTPNVLRAQRGQNGKGQKSDAPEESAGVPEAS